MQIVVPHQVHDLVEGDGEVDAHGGAGAEHGARPGVVRPREGVEQLPLHRPRRAAAAAAASAPATSASAEPVRTPADADRQTWNLPGVHQKVR